MEQYEHIKFNNELDLLRVALALIDGYHKLSLAERAASKNLSPAKNDHRLDDIVSAIRQGYDILGNAFCIVRESIARRDNGQVFTPTSIIGSMFARARTDAHENGMYSLVVDPGAGTGRYVVHAAETFPNIPLVAIEKDPVCAILLKARLSILGLSQRVTVMVGDYRTIAIPRTKGRVLFIGNPPYVRHHDIEKEWKTWYAANAAQMIGASASKLAGLHIHFFIQTHLLAKKGDFALFVTSAEWMDTKYGSALRTALAGVMGGISVHVIDAKSEPFPGVMTTAAITVFQPHSKPDSILFCKVDSAADLHELQAGHDVPVDHIATAPKWSAEAHLLFPPRRHGGTRVGDLFRVSRGQVTGCNAVWIAGPEAQGLPKRFLVPCVTAAKEIFDAVETGGRLMSTDHLQRVICLPNNLESETPSVRAKIQKFLTWATKMDGDKSYIATHRNPWWSVTLHTPAPIICTYMARRTPGFVRNDAGAGLLNIAHGLYPKVPLSPQELDEICIALNNAVSLTDGRVYAGGLTKFEPKAIEGLVIDWIRQDQTDMGALRYDLAERRAEVVN